MSVRVFLSFIGGLFVGFLTGEFWEFFIRSPCWICGLQIFSPLCSLPFYLLKRIFCKLKDFTLKFNLSIFFFYGSCFFVSSLRSLPNARSQSLFFFFYKRCKKHLTFKSMIHFELIFVFFFSFLGWLFAWAPFVEKFILPPMNYFCQQSVGYIYVGLFLDSLFCSIYLCEYISTNFPYWLL